MSQKGTHRTAVPGAQLYVLLWFPPAVDSWVPKTPYFRDSNSRNEAAKCKWRDLNRGDEPDGPNCPVFSTSGRNTAQKCECLRPEPCLSRAQLPLMLCFTRWPSCQCTDSPNAFLGIPSSHSHLHRGAACALFYHDSDHRIIES